MFRRPKVKRLDEGQWKKHLERGETLVAIAKVTDVGMDGARADFMVSDTHMRWRYDSRRDVMISVPFDRVVNYQREGFRFGLEIAREPVVVQGVEFAPASDESMLAVLEFTPRTDDEVEFAKQICMHIESFFTLDEGP